MNLICLVSEWDSVRAGLEEDQGVPLHPNLRQADPKRVEKSKMHLHSGPKQTTTKASDFPLSEAILEYKFSKKFHDFDLRLLLWF